MPDSGIRHARRGPIRRENYDKKGAEGKTGKEALRALQRQISDAIYQRLKADAARTAASSAQGPGGQPGNDSVASAVGSHPEPVHQQKKASSAR